MLIVSTQNFPPSAGGIQTLMEGLARAASAHLPVHVVADACAGDAAFDARDRPYRMSRASGPKPLRRRAKARRVARMAGAPGVAGVVCDSWKSAEHLGALPVPVLAYAHGNEFPSEGQPDARKSERIRRAFAHVDHVIAVSSHTAGRVRPLLGDGTALHVHPNPVETPPDPGPEDEAWARAQWEGLGPADGLRCLTLCRLIDWKGVDQSIYAQAQLRDAARAARLLVAGDGPDRARLDGLVETLDLGDRVRFLGPVHGARKSALYASSELFVQPGRTVGNQCEGFGITYLEAAWHGVPSVAGRDGGAPDAVLDGRTGWLVDGHETPEIVAALTSAIDAPDRRTHMGGAARERARELVWPRRIHAVLDLLDMRSRREGTNVSG